MLKLVESLLTNNPCYKKGQKITVKGLMLHSVGCAQPSASVFIKNWNQVSYSRACVHAFIDGNDGTVYQTLPWNYRGWHCGGTGNNTHIGVEMCEPSCIRYTGGATFTCSDMAKAQESARKTYEAAVALFAMLCERFSLNPLADGVILSHSEGNKRGLASAHADPEHLWRQLSLSYTMDSFRNDVKKAMAGEAPAVTVPSEMTEADIYAFFKSQGMTDCGVAGLMGNLYAESGLKSNNLQNSFEKKLSMDDETYTVAVDSGVYGNFVKDSAGYGLAQWTFWSRKQALLSFAKEKGASIGNPRMQCEFLMKELSESYKSVLAVLKSAESVRQASDAVLLGYERPADQSAVVQERRAAYGQGYYDKYAAAVEWYRVRKTWEDAETQKGAYKMLENAKKCADENTGYKVFDVDGNVVYAPDPGISECPFSVKINIPDLNIRKGPGTDYDRTGQYTGIGVFTITEMKPGKGSDSGWGRLKSGAGWIALDYAARI